MGPKAWWLRGEPENTPWPGVRHHVLWRGLRALVTTEYFTEEGDSGAGATIVATRGALLAEVSWAWPFEAGGRPDPRPLHEGTAAAASVLAAVGGVPTVPAPTGTGSRAVSAATAAALRAGRAALTRTPDLLPTGG